MPATSDRRRPALQRVHYVAGASGTGTSTRALQLQRELHGLHGVPACIVIATDVVRAQLRAVLDEAAHPDLWGESFNLPGRPGDRLRDGVDIDAFARQCAPILRAVEAGVAYALTEGWSVVVEGVHLVPGAFELVDPAAAVVSAELLVIDDPLVHAERFRARDRASAGRRPAAHYERNLDRIRAVQAELVERWAAWRASLGDDRIELLGP
ncbi:MAG: 2-phosphoglycerate kinase [Thermoleophilia bacterium]|nr:2-phosphoglycerate kinase [Thermoleophilia bacterium]